MKPRTANCFGALQQHRSTARSAAAARRTGWCFIATIVLALIAGDRVSAHGPEHEQVAQLTAHLEKHPRDLTAHLRRGELLRDHARSGDTQALTLARADFAFVLSISPKHVPAQLGMARIEADAGEWTNALRRLDQVLSISNQVATAHLQRADLLVRCHRPAEAVLAYDDALQRQREPRPETFLARARAQMASSPTNFAAAIAGLDAGIAKIGPVPGLQLMALELSLRAEYFDSALKRIDALALESDRKESWLARRGDVLAAAGRFGEARAAWEESLLAAATLPERLRNTSALQDLQASLKQKIATTVAERPAKPQGIPTP